MRLKIRHETVYDYDSEVFFEPHFLRFKPAAGPYTKLTSFRLQVSPQASGLDEQMDAEGNVVHFSWFDGLHAKFEIVAESIVELEPFNPFDFLVYPAEFFEVPFSYSPEWKELLRPSLETHLKKTPEYVKALLENAQKQTTPFVMGLTQQIHADFKVEIREEGEPLLPEKTFDLKKGSCRDLAWMQIHMLRSLGMASRFVSGYYFLDEEEAEFELHAWLEVYIPGAGWIGYDPTHGVAVEHTHIAVARSAHFSHTLPVSGTVRGDGKSKLSSSLDIQRL